MDGHIICSLEEQQMKPKWKPAAQWDPAGTTVHTHTNTHKQYFCWMRLVYLNVNTYYNDYDDDDTIIIMIWFAVFHSLQIFIFTLLILVTATLATKWEGNCQKKKIILAV